MLPLLLEAAGVVVNFLHGTAASELKKSKYKEKFDLVYISHLFAHEISEPAFQGTLKPQARVVAETSRFVRAAIA